MSLFSFNFLLFFLVVVVIYWLGPRTKIWQNSVIFLASIIFIALNNLLMAEIILFWGICLYLLNVVTAIYFRSRTFNIAYYTRQVTLLKYKELVKRSVASNTKAIESLDRHSKKQKLLEISDIDVLLEQTKNQPWLNSLFYIVKDIKSKLIIFQLNSQQLNSQQNSKEFQAQQINPQTGLESSIIVDNKTAVGPFKQYPWIVDGVKNTDFSQRDFTLNMAISLADYYNQLSSIIDSLNGQQVKNQQLIDLNVHLNFCDKLALEFDVDWTKLANYHLALLDYSQQKHIGYKPIAPINTGKDSKPNARDINPSLLSGLKRLIGRDMRYARASQDAKTIVSLSKTKVTSITLPFVIVILLSLSPLFTYKYLDNILELLNFNILDLAILIGVSYLTFNGISLLVAVKRGELKRVGLLTTLTFFTFFPTLISGPIQRATYLIPILNSTREIKNIPDIFFKLMMGLLKIWWLSSFLESNFVNQVFASPELYNSMELLLAASAYSFQLYFNFSGYTDLMYAVALCFGINNPANFNAPFASLNIKDFWVRWHMSLSSWIRDYIYIPLGGNRKGFVLAQIYMVFAMCLSGIWHGSSWNFLFWGLLHSIGICLINIFNKITTFRLSNISVFLSRWFTFIFVTFAFIWFKAESLEVAWTFIKSIYNNWTQPLTLNNSILALVIMLVFVSIQPLLYSLANSIRVIINRAKLIQIVPIVILVLALVITFAPSGIPNFIYAGF